MRVARERLAGAVAGGRVYVIEAGDSPGFAFTSTLEALSVPR